MAFGDSLDSLEESMRTLALTPQIFGFQTTRHSYQSPRRTDFFVVSQTYTGQWDFVLSLSYKISILGYAIMHKCIHSRLNSVQY